MRILVLTNIFPTDRRPMGGSYVTERVAAHRRAGHEVEMLALRMRPDPVLRTLFRRTGRDDEAGPIPGMTPVDYRMSTAMFARNKWGPSSLPLAERVARQVERTVAVSNFDVIHAHGMYRPPAGLVADILSARHGVPFVVTAHGTDINVAMVQRPHEFTEVFERARAVMYVSPPLMDRALELGAPRHNAVHVPNGVDLEIFSAGEGARVPEVLFVGNLAPVKGADRLAEIFSGVRRSHPDASLTVIGVGPLDHSVRSKLERTGAVFLGQQPRAEVAAAMRRAGVLLIPSRSEGWPCVILEAQASGTAVVATDVGGIRGAVGEGGTVVPHDDQVVESLTTAVVRWLEHPADPAALRERASRFSWDEIARQEREAME